MDFFIGIRINPLKLKIPPNSAKKSDGNIIPGKISNVNIMLVTENPSGMRSDHYEYYMKEPITISGAGCCLVDQIYPDIDFSATNVTKYMSRTKGDGGLHPGQTGIF